MDRFAGPIYVAIVVLVLTAASNEVVKFVEPNWVVALITPIVITEVMLAILALAAYILKSKSLKYISLVLLLILSIDILLSPISMTPLSYITGGGPSYYKVRAIESPLLSINRNWLVVASIVMMMLLRFIEKRH